MRIIAQGDNTALKEKLLSKVASGKISSGVSFSHLRDLKRHAIIAKATSKGIEITGEAFWVSGYRLFNYLVVGFFFLDEEKEGFAWIPFQQGKGIKITDPLSTVALSSLQTVRLSFENLIVTNPKAPRIGG